MGFILYHLLYLAILNIEGINHGVIELSYTKFVILGEQRTGSNFLQMLLASHNNVLCFGELFNENEDIRRKSLKIAYQLVKEDEAINLGDLPDEYLENHIYKKYPSYIKAVGFRLFYTHGKNLEWSGLWEYLSIAMIKVIHLKRKNLLDRYLSHELANETNTWMVTDKENTSFKQPINLHPANCFKDFHRSVKFQKEADSFFSNSPKIDVYYEDLYQHLSTESRRIQEFLNLEFNELYSVTKKQQRKKKSEMIENYHELKERLIECVSKNQAPKDWLSFFDDE